MTDLINYEVYACRKLAEYKETSEEEAIQRYFRENNIPSHKFKLIRKEWLPGKGMRVILEEDGE